MENKIMSKHNAFLDIVKERHDPSLFHKRENLDCPFCNSTNIKFNGSRQTLVGGRNNHIWNNFRCKDCGKDFIFEVKESEKDIDFICWITKDKKILKGIPGCYEDYIYTCNKCGGDVHRIYDAPINNGIQILSTKIDDNGNSIKQYKVIFGCKDCGQNVESDNEYFELKPPVKKTKKVNTNKIDAN
jgi:transcription elongation factor Elf1